jgi:Flp pilus assembly protein TadG
MVGMGFSEAPRSGPFDFWGLNMLKRQKNLRSAESGVVAVEFALLAIPLLLLIIGIVETALFFAAGTILEGASASAARLVRTGQVQGSADPETAFEDRLCDQASALIDCADIQYEVIRVAANNFAGAESYESEFDEDGNLVAQPFSTGDSNDVVLVRAIYRYEFLTPFLGHLMTGDPGKDWMTHMATVVIKAEPYNFGEE